MSIPFRPTDRRRIALHFDGLRYSFGMAKLATRRMTETLDEVADRYRKDQHSEDHVMSALLDAWCIIDMCHRVRELIDQLPQLPRKEPWVKKFLRQSMKVEELRHHIQHLRRTVNSSDGLDPVWGSLSWIPTDEPETCYMIFSGSLLEGLTAASIAYDTHEGRYTAQVQLSASNEISVDLVAVARLLERLRKDLVEWVKGKPKTTHAYGKTLIWKWSVLENPPGTQRVVEL